METVEILRGAKAALERNGWTRHDFYDHIQFEDGTVIGECRVCLLGAVNLAVTGHPVRTNEAATSAINVLERLVGDCSVPSWNDRASRTVDEVYALLDEAIELAEGGVSDGR